MSFTFYKAKGWSVGKSMVEDAHLDLAKDLMKNAAVLTSALCRVQRCHDFYILQGQRQGCADFCSLLCAEVP